MTSLIDTASVYPKKERLASLDILRGLDLFLLVFLQPIIISISRHWSDVPFFSFLIKQFSHADWVGFTVWDLVMPLFLFMVGCSLPFSVSKYYSQKNKRALYRRIIKRFTILFFLGAIVQGNLLSLNPLYFRLFSNTLQAIAVGYLFSSLFILHMNIKMQIITTSILLFGYWALMTFLGDFTPEDNFAEIIDKAVLGRFRDGVSYDENKVWSFSPHYNYTWVLSSMTFIVTTMMGTFAGTIMMKGKSKLRNVKLLIIIGIFLLVSGWLLSFQTPIIKKIWSASMTLWSAGWCFLLMGIFYFIIDYMQWSKGLNWLKIYGMNSITAYTLGMVVSFRSISTSLLFGLEQYIGDFYSTLIIFADYLILFLILRLMYKQKVFIKI